jgi:uncharacterized glyoxalase superfamily protein PhnB
MMKRSKKKQLVRNDKKIAAVATCNADAAALRSADPDRYFAEKVKAYTQVMMNTHVADEAIKKAYEKGVDDGGTTITENLGVTFTAAMCRTLHEKYGFGKKRLVEIMERMNEIMLNTFTTIDAVQSVYREIGLKFTEEDPFNWLSID